MKPECFEKEAAKVAEVLEELQARQPDDFQIQFVTKLDPLRGHQQPF